MKILPRLLVLLVVLCLLVGAIVALIHASPQADTLSTSPCSPRVYDNKATVWAATAGAGDAAAAHATPQPTCSR